MLIVSSRLAKQELSGWRSDREKQQSKTSRQRVKGAAAALQKPPMCENLRSAGKTPRGWAFSRLAATRSLVMLMAVLLVASAKPAVGVEEQPEQSGFEVASHWARVAHGFRESDIVLDDDVAAESAAGGVKSVVDGLVSESGAGFMRFAFKLLSEGLFGATSASNEGLEQGAPQVAENARPAVTIETLDRNLQSMEILDDDDALEEQSDGQDYAHLPPVEQQEEPDEQVADEFHQVRYP